MVEGDIAYPQQADSPTTLDRLHRPPRCPVIRAQALVALRPVQHVRIEEIASEVLQGIGARLLDLRRDGGGCVVRQAVVLPRAERKLGLEEEILPGHKTASDRHRDGPSDSRLVVMLALVGGVDPAKAPRERERRQALRLVFLPGRAVQEAGHAHAVDRKEWIGHRFPPARASSHLRRSGLSLQLRGHIGL